MQTLIEMFSVHMNEATFCLLAYCVSSISVVSSVYVYVCTNTASK